MTPEFAPAYFSNENDADSVFCGKSCVRDLAANMSGAHLCDDRFVDLCTRVGRSNWATVRSTDGGNSLGITDVEVSPLFTSKNLGNLFTHYPVAICQLLMGHTSSKVRAANVVDLFRGELRTARTLATRLAFRLCVGAVALSSCGVHSTFVATIQRVFQRGSIEQMRRVAARRVVAAVQDQGVTRINASRKEVGHSMRAQGRMLGAELPVSVLVPAKFPRPTSIGRTAFNVAVKSLNVFGCQCGQCPSKDSHVNKYTPLVRFSASYESAVA